MRSGSTVTHLVELPDGAPTTLSWTLYAGATTLTSDTITPASGSVSVTIVVPSSFNTLSSGTLLGFRSLEWTYQATNGPVIGSYSYELEGRLLFPASTTGVRSKLGLEAFDLPDDQIPLTHAFLKFEDAVGASALAAFVSGSTISKVAIADAVEAWAALELLPGLQISVAQQQSSGTDRFIRGKIDWDMLRAKLLEYVTAGRQIINSAFDPTADYGALLLLTSPIDRLTGQ